ncbi:guanine nucleotide-binding protein subunit gamma 2-like isoform X2 [Hibiscus syriacus]|uniref:guanine nucleotide-binding protein subunit gamma 2-like isoform X2 n=1 Tax=Hibiscus syriacus TaxID=106335 RepID=UPI001924218F|nr:guanine nucleotide-binding protein subunit gamma 2-like isoform X2 [Hibiscus syriacus]
MFFLMPLKSFNFCPFFFLFLHREMQSGRLKTVVSPIPQRIRSFQAADTRGKHRVQAELKRLEQEARFLEEELEQIERMEKASAASKEMLGNVESKPDPLLPVTNGPIIPVWDQWFEGPQEAQGCKCWIL